MNRRLGTNQSTEADILYGGKIGGDAAAIIVECKNRPIKVVGKAILLPKGDTEDTAMNITSSLARKALDARNNLGIRQVRFLVVGSTQTEFIQQTKPGCIVVGQRVEAWIRGSTKVQQFHGLQEAWRELTKGFEPLPLDSQALSLLRSLPKFTPWASREAIEARERQREEDSHASESFYYEKARLDEMREQGNFLRQKEADIEDGWYYPDD